jgi:hypothetical protein
MKSLFVGCEVHIVFGNEWEQTMLSTHKKMNRPFAALMVLFTIFGIPIIIALPFLIWGFIGRM